MKLQWLLAHLEQSSSQVRKNKTYTPYPEWQLQDCLADLQARSRQILHGGTVLSKLATEKKRKKKSKLNLF